MNFKRLLAESIVWRGLYFFSVLLVNVFLSRYLQAAGSGNLYFISIIFSFMQVLLGLGFDAGITYFGSAKIIQKNKLVSIAALWSVAAGIVMIAFVYIFFLVDTSMSKDLLPLYFLYGFCYVLGQSLMVYLTSLYYTQENYFLPNLLLSLVILLSS
jgi:hypothetical protein